MVAHSSILAWRIPWTEEPGGHDQSVLAHVPFRSAVRVDMSFKTKKFIAVLLSYLPVFVNSVGLSQLPKTSLFEGTEKAFYVDTQAKNLCLSHDGILGNHLWTILPFCWG